MRKSIKAALRAMTSPMRVTLLVACIGSSGANACLFSSLGRTFFFEAADLERGVDAPAIAEVTIVALGNGNSPDGRYWTAVARVDRVLKGQIDDKATKIKVMWAPTNCDLTFKVGARGIVVGTIERDSQGALELMARFESLEEREKRRNSNARN